MTLQNTCHIASHFVRARWRWRHLQGAALVEYQEQRARRIVAHALQHSPLYREHWSGCDPCNWRTLPTVDKQLMMTHFDTFNTRGITCAAAMDVALQAERSRDFRPMLDGLTVGLSSGTSGHRGLFLANAAEQAAWAGIILARTLHQLQLHRLRVAFFLRSDSNLYEAIGGALLQFRYFDLMLPLAEVNIALNSFQPDIVVGPSSLLGFLAQARMRGELHIRPTRLIAVAEVLEPQDQAFIMSVFDVPVHQIYQCTEGLLAVSCEKGSLHIQEDIVMLQFERLPGEDERFTPIVTDLWRRTQPIIRYRLNDVLQVDTHACTCGVPFRVIRAIEGRCDDICYFESYAGGTRPFFPDTVRRMILLASPYITDYQVVQEGVGDVHIRLAVVPEVPFSTVVEAVHESVAATVAQYDCCAATVRVEEGLLPVAARAKRRRVQRVK